MRKLSNINRTSAYPSHEGFEANAPNKSPRPRIQIICACLALMCLGWAGNFFSISLLHGFQFLFGSIAALMALELLGLFPGLVVAAAASSVTFFMWNHPYFIAISMAEILFIACARRYFGHNILMACVTYWLVPGAALIYLFYGLVMNTEGGGLLLILLKQAVNGIFNGVAASLVLMIWKLRKPSVKPLAQITIHEALFQILFTIIFIPALIFLVLSNRSRLERMEVTLTKDARHAGEGISHFLDEWFESHMGAVLELARRSREVGVKPSDQLQLVTSILHSTYPGFYNMYVADASATTVAFDPPFSAKGENLIGINFADRDYVAELKRTRKPVVSDVFVGRGGIESPIVILSVPVLNDEKFLGYALGAATVEQIYNILELYTKSSGFLATLVDRRGQVIASTAAHVHPLDTYGEFPGDVIRTIDPHSYHRMPQLGTTPIMIAWQKSFYGYHQTIPELGWTLYTEAPLGAATSSLERSYAESFSYILAVSLLTLILSAQLSRRIERPISQLASLTTNLPHQLRLGSKLVWPQSRLSEVARLVENFTVTTQDLTKRIRDLETAEESINITSQDLAAKNEALAQEITVRIETEAKLNQAIVVAQEASRAKGEFLANMSHEIRTPLGAILGFAELLKSGPLNPDIQRDYISAILRNGEQLLGVIGDVLDLSKIESGHLQVELLKVALLDIIDGGIMVLQQRVRDRGLKLQLEFDGPVPDVVRTDPIRLRQILLNIVGNAIKFTDEGVVSVTISVDRVSSQTQHSMIIRIADTGIGIPMDRQKELFQPFVQADSSMTRRFGGTGLGLALSKRLAEVLGGDLKLRQSEPGKGSCFELAIDPGPLNEARYYNTPEELRKSFAQQVQDDKNAPEIQLDGLRVLLVDDSADNRFLLSRILNHVGAQVEIAENGVACLKKIKSLEFDAILMDIQMPEMDGYEATRQLRSSGYKLPIIALSAHAQAHDKKRYLESGFNHYLTKPVNRKLLLELLAPCLALSKKSESS